MATAVAQAGVPTRSDGFGVVRSVFGAWEVAPSDKYFGHRIRQVFERLCREHMTIMSDKEKGECI